MHPTTHRLLFVALLTVMVSLAYAINYQYFSHYELTVFGDRIKFWHEDTLAGPVRSNSAIAIMENPAFYDFVVTTASDFWHSAGYNPRFLGPDPFFNADTLPFPSDAGRIRDLAFQQGYYLNAGPGMLAWARIRHDTLKVAWLEEGEPLDSLPVFYDILLPDTATVFFDAPLRISGTVSTVLTIGASGRIGLEDNIFYASSALPQGIPAGGHAERFALVSEGEIKVLNTQANGRNDQWRYAFEPPDSMNVHDIGLNGIYVALNESFTFENQNDSNPDSGYICDCSPDDRGIIYLYGSLMQKRRGYTHRSNLTSTGYLKYFRYDNDLRYWNFHLWSDTLRENLVTPTQINFGNVMVGDTVWDTVYVYNDFVPIWLSNIASDYLTPASSSPPAFAHGIPVGFAPPGIGTLNGVLIFDNPYYNQTITIWLTGTGIAESAGESVPAPQSFSLSAYPNPFNSRAQIRFTLPSEGQVSLIVYDVQGREVMRLVDGIQSPGIHTAHLDGSNLGTGLYFATLKTRTDVRTQKLLLIK